MLSKKDIENFKTYLETNTNEAKLVKILLIAVGLSLLPFIAIGAAGIGNAVQIFKNKKYNKRQINDGLRYLKNNNFIQYVSDSNGTTTFRITRKGETKLRSLSMDNLCIKKPSKWDGKWRIIMFDLPVRYKNIRNALRYKLKQIGFVQLQKSVWIYPYPCTEEILFIADYYKVRNYIDVMTVSELINDDKLKRSFHLTH